MVTNEFAEWVASSAQECVGDLTKWLRENCGKYEDIFFKRVEGYDCLWNISVLDGERVERARALPLGWRRTNANVAARARIQFTVHHKTDRIIWNNDLEFPGDCLVRGIKWTRRFDQRFCGLAGEAVKKCQDHIYRSDIEFVQWIRM